MPCSRQAPQEAATLSLTICLAVQSSLLRIGVLDNSQVERGPLLHRVVFGRERWRCGKLLTGLFQITHFAKICERFLIVLWVLIAILEFDGKLGDHLVGL